MKLDAVKRDELMRGLVFVSLVAIAVTVRLLSETPNFNAVTAAALFAVAVLGNIADHEAVRAAEPDLVVSSLHDVISSVRRLL